MGSGPALLTGLPLERGGEILPSRAGDSVTGRDLLHLLKHLSMISKAITEIRTNLRNKNKIVEFPWQGAKNSAGVSFALGVPACLVRK